MRNDNYHAVTSSRSTDDDDDGRKRRKFYYEKRRPLHVTCLMSFPERARKRNLLHFACLNNRNNDFYSF